MDTITSNLGVESVLRQLKDLVPDAPISSTERRNAERFPFLRSLQLTPLDRDGQLLHEATITVIGRDLSATGIGISHDQPILHRRAVVFLEHPQVGKLDLEVEILWTRRTPIGRSESGCRLVKVVAGHTFCME